MSRKFACFVEWNYRGKPEDQFERCLIYPATRSDEEHDGDNCVSGKGVDGFSLDVFPSLKDAMLCSLFNPFAMTFDSLTEDESKEKDEVLSKCSWGNGHLFYEGKEVKRVGLVDNSNPF